MATLTIRNEAGQVIGTPDVGSRAVLWRDRTTTLRDLRDTEVQQWVSHHEQLIADPAFQPREPRLAATQRELLDLVVSVRDEAAY